MHARGVRARTHARVGGWVEVGIAQTRRENHILFYSSLSNGASKLSYQLKLILHCKVQYFGKAHNCCGMSASPQEYFVKNKWTESIFACMSSRKYFCWLKQNSLIERAIVCA